MNIRLCTGLAAIVCLSLASCYPYNENQGKKKPTNGTEKKVSPEDQEKKKEAEAKKKAEDALKKKKEQNADNTRPTDGGETTPPTNGAGGGGEATPGPEPKRDYAFANKVPGKEGFVFSPFNNKVVDVRDIPSGTLVQDPTFPAAEKKYFRVP